MIDPPPGWLPLDRGRPEPLSGMPRGDALWQPSSRGRPEWLTPQMVDLHAPWDWRDRYRTGDPWKAIQVMARRPSAVVSMDVRKSTEIRIHVQNRRIFEAAMHNFFTGAIGAIRSSGLWLDKFLGDGLLAYGPVWGNDRYGAVPVQHLLQILGQLSAIFEHATMRALRQLLGADLPQEAGLAIGIDAGVVGFWPMWELLEIQGDPVVVATRMQTAARAGEIVASPNLGSTIEHDRARALPSGMLLWSDRRQTKEEPNGVDVSVMRYTRRPVPDDDGRIRSWTAGEPRPPGAP